MSRIALIGDNSIEYISCLIDIWNNGDCAVLIDSQIPAKTATDMLFEAQVEKCYIEQKYYNQLLKTTDKRIKIVPYLRNTIYTQFLPKEIYEKFHENYSRDEAIVIYSSGTTGKSKGIILSHFAINTNADAIIDYMHPTKDDRMYVVKRFTHSSTITGELLVALKTKIPILIAPVVVPPRYVLSNIYKYKISIIGVNPLLLSMYAIEYKNRDYDISLLKKIYVSGSILSDKIYKLAHDIFDKQEIYNVYGLSEAGPRVAAQRFDCCKSNSVGKPINGVEITIVDNYGVCVDNNVRGIIHIKSPSIFSKYICGETKHKSLYQGWLNTGDIGFFDEHGELHITCRLDEMIIIDAHKVYPSEVERQICSLDDVYECIVTMVVVCGENVLCCLYSSKRELRTDIRNKLNFTLMKHEIPKIFIRTDFIPRTINGKADIPKIKKIIIKHLERKNES